MDIHRLRVVTFDNSLEDLIDKPIDYVFEENVTDKSLLKFKDPENKPPINIFYVGDNSELVDKEKEGKDYFHEEGMDDKSSAKIHKPYTSKYDGYIKKREAKKGRDKSKNFRKSRKRIKYKCRNTTSFENVMKTLSSKNNEYFVRVQNNLQTFRKPSSLIPMHIKRKENNNRSKIPNELKVLYMSETAKSHKGTKKHYSNKHTIERNLPARMKSFSSHDFFAFHRNRLIYSPYFYHYNERPYDVRFCNAFRKNKTRYTERYPKYRSRRSFFKIRRVKSNVSDCCEMPMHFTLVDFPSASNTYCAANSFIKIHDDTADNNRRSCKNKEVLVKPSRFQVSKKTLCDTAVLTSRSVQGKHFCSCQTSAHQFKKSSKNVPIHYAPTEISDKMFCMSKSKHSGKKDNSAKVILKYFLVGFMIIVWLPCVALIGLLWLLTYPMRPHYDPPDQCHTKCIKEVTEKEFLTHFIDFTKQIAKDTFCSLKAIGRTIKPDDKECKRSTSSCRSPVRRSCRAKSYPDPNEKYTLYYADKRGWMMKPIRRRLAKKQNTFRNKICNGFNKFCQKCIIIPRRELVIESVSGLKIYESSHNKVTTKCPCERDDAPIDMYCSPQVSGSQRKIVESHQKFIAPKKSSQTQKYGTQNNLVQSPSCKQCLLSQQVFPMNKSTAVRPSASKSQSQHSSPRLSPVKRLVSKGTSSPQIRKISDDHKVAKKEVALTVARDRRNTPTDDKLNKLHRKSTLENAARRIKIEATRRCKKSQCNLIKKKSPARAPCRKKKAKPRKVPLGQKMCYAYKTVCTFFKSLDNADKIIEVKCEDLYLHTLRKKPCICVYN